MNSIFALNHPLHSLFWPEKYKLFKNIVLVIAGVFILALSAQLSIPFKPVPLTFQSATVLLIGLLFGARLGAATIGAYLLAGACGLPVFEGMGAGIQILFFHPTAGYLFGFFFAVLISGYLTQRGWGKHFISSLAAGLLGAAVIFLMGLFVLSLYVGWNQAYQFGLKPFLISEPLKLIALAWMVPHFWKRSASTKKV